MTLIEHAAAFARALAESGPDAAEAAIETLSKRQRVEVTRMVSGLRLARYERAGGVGWVPGSFAPWQRGSM